MDNIKNNRNFGKTLGIKSHSNNTNFERQKKQCFKRLLTWWNIEYLWRNNKYHDLNDYKLGLLIKMIKNM